VVFVVLICIWTRSAKAETAAFDHDIDDLLENNQNIARIVISTWLWTRQYQTAADDNVIQLYYALPRPAFCTLTMTLPRRFLTTERQLLYVGPINKLVSRMKAFSIATSAATSILAPIFIHLSPVTEVWSVSAKLGLMSGGKEAI